MFLVSHDNLRLAVLNKLCCNAKKKSTAYNNTAINLYQGEGLDTGNIHYTFKKNNQSL